MLRWLPSCVLGLLLVAGAGNAPLAVGAPDYRFKLSGGAPPVTLSATVLSPEERAFLAELPEIRVALRRMGAPPYERIDADGQISGVQAEMLGALARTFGLRIRPVVLADRHSVLNAVKSGQADMVLTVAVSAERLQYLSFTLGTASLPVAVLSRKAAPQVEQAGARIALEREHFSNEVVARRYPGATVVPTNTALQALRLVAEGGADAYVGSLLEAVDLLARDPLPGIEVQQILSSGTGYYHFGVRKDWARLVTILNKGITSWRASPDPISAAAVGALAASAVAGGGLQPPFVLTPAEAAALVERSVWRIGAVRGLGLLNDVGVHGAHSGIAADYAEQVARRLGVGLALVPFDSVAEMLDALRAERIDVVPFLTRTEERARQFGFSKPYFEMPYVLVARSDAPLYWDLASLRGKRLALALQHPLREFVARRFAGITVLDANDGNEAMDMVARGDADAAVEVKLFANLRINADDGGRLRALGNIDELPAQFRFATSAQALALLPLIDRALADIEAPERERLLRRWVAVDLRPARFPWRRWAPALAVALAALLALAGASAWWMRRLAREVSYRRRADEQLGDIGRTMPGVVFRYAVGAEGELVPTFLSSGAEAFLSIRPAPGLTVLSVIGPRLRPGQWAEAEAAQSEALRTGQPYRHTVAYTRPDGRELWLHCEAVCSTTREAQVAWTGYLIDVSAEHDLQERLAQEAKERHLLLASASHELRSPAHTLALALQDEALLQLPATAARPLEIARDAVRTIAQLLDDVLDTARLDAGRLELRLQEFDLQALLEQIMRTHRPELTAKGLGFVLECDPRVPRTVHADPLRLKQVLMNLLSNAAKYTQAGSVRLVVGLGSLAADTPALQLEVRDTGVGIPLALQQRLFEPFVTLGAGGAGSPSSSGLGLSICRRLVELMGGTITLHSEFGVGTGVQVLLPLLAPPPGGSALKREGALLLCDDDEVSLLLMAAALARLGYPALQVGSGQAALARWREGGVRVLVTDLTMPGLDGSALIQAIRSAEAGAAERTGIVVCSGSAPPVAGPGAAPPPYDAFISKPVDLNALGDTLRRLMA